MHVIGHQHIGVHRTTEPTRELAQLTEIIPVVLLSRRNKRRGYYLAG